MRFLNRLLQVTYRFIAPIGGIVGFSAALVIAVAKLNEPVANVAFLTQFIVLDCIALFFAVLLLLVANHRRFRHKWRDWDREWYGEGDGLNDEAGK
jgi:high-affinity Fe2+/Pb2+ permease